MVASRKLASFLASPIVLCLAGLACGGDDSGAAAADGGNDAAGDASSELAPLWDGNTVPYDAGGPSVTQRVPVASSLVSREVDAQGMMFAAGEMQISGEPFAQFFAGRNLNFYDRAFLPPDQYLIPVADGGVFDQLLGQDVNPIPDVFGFSTAVESYEYSKYHMNSIVEWGAAGVSLANGPLVAALGQGTGQANLIMRIDQVLTLAGTDVGGYAVLPPPTNNPLNILGFAGLTPVFAPYRAFDPTIQGSTQEVQSCNRAGGYGGIPTQGMETPEYECEYNQLHVPDSQLDHTLVPAVLGFATWKQALWAIDFGGRIHDSGSNQVNAINPSDEAAVGTHGNTVVATDPPGSAPGTYIGSTPLEGMWGLNMIVGMDNLAAWLLSALTTTDGATLGGFASTMDAIAFDYTSPLRWFPTAVTVGVDATQTFPPVTSLVIADGTSRSVDLAALLLGYSKFFAMTDARNPGIGQRIGLQILFDGNHQFPADDGMPDGEATAHDRALGVVRVAFVDLERIHADPTLGVLVDTASVAAGTVSRGTTVTTTNLAHTLIGMREAVLSLDAAVTQYGAADEDPSGDAQGILNSIPIHPPPGGTPGFSSHVRDVFVKNATFVRDVLTTSAGQVVNGATIANGQATPMGGPATLESQGAAARALTEAFLLTGDTTFRDQARAVVQHLHDAFYSAPLDLFRGQEGGPDEVHVTPERFAWLQSALRETHKALHVDGDPILGRPALEAKIARVNTLYMNGWDDLNGNQQVDHGDGGPNECLGARLQQAEQSLTGELGRDDFGLPTADRDSDCVIELGHAQSLSVFAGEVLFFQSP